MPFLVIILSYWHIILWCKIISLTFTMQHYIPQLFCTFPTTPQVYRYTYLHQKLWSTTILPEWRTRAVTPIANQQHPLNQPLQTLFIMPIHSRTLFRTSITKVTSKNHGIALYFALDFYPTQPLLFHQNKIWQNIWIPLTSYQICENETWSWANYCWSPKGFPSIISGKAPQQVH